MNKAIKGFVHYFFLRCRTHSLEISNFIFQIKGVYFHLMPWLIVDNTENKLYRDTTYITFIFYYNNDFFWIIK